MMKFPLARKTAVVGLVATAFAAVFIVFDQATHVVLVAFAGLLLAVYLRGIAILLERWTKIPRAVGVGVTVALHAAAVVAFAWLGWSGLSSQLDAVYEALPRAIERIRDDLNAMGPIGAYLSERVPTSLDELPTAESRPLSQVRDAMYSGASFLIDLVVILIVGVYGALEPQTYRRGLLMLIPATNRPRIGSVMDELAVTLRWWWVGRLSAAAIVGLLSTIGLLILGVPLAPLMGALAAILTFIPNLGPFLAFIPPAMLALLESRALMWGVFGLYAGIQFLESYFITPMIQKRAVHVPPAMLIIAQVFGGVMAGPIGLALADPIAAVAIVLTRRLYVEDVLGTKPAPRDEEESEDEGADEREREAS